LIFTLQIHGLPTLIFVGMDASKPALRTEGLLPAQARPAGACCAAVVLVAQQQQHMWQQQHVLWLHQACCGSLLAVLSPCTGCILLHRVLQVIQEIVERDLVGTVSEEPAQ
jgi:hypothetical protein